jgi:hypothetical protein
MQLFRGLGDDVYLQSKNLRNKLFTILIYIGNHSFGREFNEKIQYLKSEISSSKIKAQGWRSVSFVIPSFSHIVYSKEDAPEFLKRFESISY